MPKVILFDFDGPLVDSLGKHIEFCWRINQKYGSKFSLPDINDTKAWQPLIGFPMVVFLSNLGFSADDAKKIHKDDYLPEFQHQKNPPPLQPGTAELILKLRQAGNRLGIVSLNHRRNIISALGSLINAFEVIYSCDEYDEKPPALTAASLNLGCLPNQATYIGDAIADYEAAKKINMPFIGVSYGWQITGQEVEFASANNPEELELMLAFTEEDTEE